MVKTQSNSTIEIWSKDYINYDERQKIKRIIQIEPAGSPDEYIVEFVMKIGVGIYD